MSDSFLDLNDLKNFEEENNENIRDKDSKEPFCEFCNKNTKFRISGNEYVCNDCGFVFEDREGFVETSSVKLHATEDQSLYDNTPNIAEYRDNFGKNIDYNLVKSLKRTIQKTKVNSSCSRSKMKGLYEIERLGNVLDLNKQTENKIIEQFLYFNKKSVFKNKNMHSCIAALTSIICNRTGIPLSITEILKYTSVTKTKFNMDFFYLMHLFDTPGPTCAPIRAHLKKYLSFISPWQNEKQFYTTLNLALDKTEVLEKEGREGIVGVASIIYMLLKYYAYPYCDVMLKHLIINRLTIKNAWKLITQQFPELSLYTVNSKKKKRSDKTDLENTNEENMNTDQTNIDHTNVNNSLTYS